MKSALIFGSNTGNTGYVAGLIIEALKPEITLDIIDVEDVDAEALSRLDFALCGIPTWDVGQLEQGWNEIFVRLDEVDLDGLTVAMFGLGELVTTRRDKFLYRIKCIGQSYSITNWPFAD